MPNHLGLKAHNILQCLHLAGFNKMFHLKLCMYVCTFTVVIKYSAN